MPLKVWFSELILGFIAIFMCTESLPTDYQCGNSSQFIKRHKICDGRIDCPGGTEEINCLEHRACVDSYGVRFKCNNGKCISYPLVCDGIKHCSTNEDETNCDQFINPYDGEHCAAGRWKCQSGICTEKGFYCDTDVNDCNNDGSDEPYGCTKVGLIGPDAGKFRCNSGECVDFHHRCDNVRDCPDDSDERRCPPFLEPAKCSNYQNKTLCKSRRACINISQVCDTNIDCPDRSDEFRDCSKACDDCQQGCIPLADSILKRTCTCYPGYKTSPTNTSNCIDIDECEEFGTCQQSCKNLPGSYECSCYSGFTFANDNKTCEYNGNASIIVALQSGIRVLSLGHDEKEHFLVEKIGLPESVTYDSRRNYVYWTDLTDRNESIWKSRLDGFELEIFVNTGLNKPDGLAYDWIGNNIYFSDSIKFQIVVCRSEGEVCAILIAMTESDAPRSLALDPNNGLMYWVSWINVTSSKIFRAEMDGSSVEAIVTRNIQRVYGIAVDQEHGRIYYTSGNDQIETVKSDGTDRWIVRVGYPDRQAFGIDIFGDWVYWTDRNLYDIRACNKFFGTNKTTVAKEPMETINRLVVFSEANQPINRQSSCENANCSHICVLGRNNIFQCKCPVGMKLLSPNDRNCSDDLTKVKFLVGYNNLLKTMSLDSIGRNVFDEYKLQNVSRIGAFVYNPVNDTIILSDLDTNKIYEFNRKTHSFNVLLEDKLESVNGMDFDVIGYNLYWVDSVKRTVEVMSLKTKARVILFKDFGQPADIVVTDKYIIIASNLPSGGFEIVRLALNGLNRIVIFHGSKGEIFCLSYDYSNTIIFWTDSRSNSVQSASLVGRSINHRSYTNSVSNAPFGIASYNKGRIIWTDRKTNLLYSETHSNQPTFFGQYLQMPNSSRVFQNTTDLLAKVKVIQELSILKTEHQCSGDSPDRIFCSHICSMSEDKSRGVCMCPQGFVLKRDGQTCKPDTSGVIQIPLGCVDGNCQPIVYTQSTTSSTRTTIVETFTTKKPKTTVKTFSNYALSPTERYETYKAPETDISYQIKDRNVIDDKENGQSFSIFISVINLLGLIGIISGAVWMFVMHRATKTSAASDHQENLVLL